MPEINTTTIKEVGKDEVWCDWYKCNNCGGEMITEDSNYCPDCGYKIIKEN